MALLNLLLIPFLTALGLLETATGGDGSGSSDAGGGTGGNAGGTTDKGAAGAGSGTSAGGQGAAGASGSAGGTPTASGVAGKGGTAGAGGQAPPPQQGTSLEDIAKLQRELNEARQQAGQYRTAGIQAIAAALGIDLPKPKGGDDGQEAAIAQLQQEITTLREEARSGKLDATFERVVSKLGAKPVLTRRYVDGQLKDLDPKADDFTTKLEQIVQAAIDEEPALKATQAASRSGGEFNGGNEADGDAGALSVEDLRKKRAEWRGDSITH